MKKSGLLFKYEEESEESGLSSFGGVPVFLEFLKSIRFDSIVNGSFQSTGKQGYSPLHYILSFILLNITGGESISDIDYLERDSGLKKVFKCITRRFINMKNREFRRPTARTFPSQSRLFGFLDKFNSPDEEKKRKNTPKGKSSILPVSDTFENLTTINQDVIKVAQHLSPCVEATLDMDNNIIESAKANARISYKKCRSYQPFNVYWAEQDLMVHSQFRDGNVPPGKEQMHLFKEAEALLPSNVKKVYHRSDTAGYQHELLEYLESEESRFGRIEFAISCNVTKSFRRAVNEVYEAQWKPIVYEDPDGFLIETEQEFAEVCYTPEIRNHSKDAPVFRYLAIREATDVQRSFTSSGQITFNVSDNAVSKLHLEEMNNKVYKVFGVVTNRSLPPLEIILWHRKRCGNSEQEHSRLTHDMAGGRFPSNSFGENAAWWYMSMISLNLLKIFQRETLPPTLKRVRIKKLNHHLLRIAVKVIYFKNSLKVVMEKGSDFFKLVSFTEDKMFDLRQRVRTFCLEFD